GCTLFYLLTGQPPFPGTTPLAKLVKHHTEQPPVLEQLRPEVLPALGAIVRKLLAKYPAERYQTPADLARALAALPRDKITPAPPPRPREPARLLRRLEGHRDWVKGLGFLPDGRLVSCGLDGTVRAWEPATGRMLWSSEGHADGVLCLACAPDGRLIVT